MMGLSWVAAWALFGVLGEIGVAHEASVTVVVHPPDREVCLSPERGHDHFGDSTVRVEMDVLGRVGSMVDLVGQLFQFTAALAVPTGEPMKIVTARTFDDTARFRVSIPVPLPAVKRPSQFDLRIRGRSDAKSAWRTVGHQVFEVYPHGILSELSHAENIRIFILSDHDAKLSSFLEGEGLPYKMLSDAVLSDFPLNRIADRSTLADRNTDVMLVLRVLSSETHVRRGRTNDSIVEGLLRKGFRIIEFREKVGTVPAVIIRKVGPGVHTNVEMPLIDDLADSPRAQLFLLDVIRLTLEGGQP